MAESSTTSNGFVIPRSSNLYKPKEEEETPDYASSERYRENERNPMRTKAYDAVIAAGGNPNAARIAAEAVDFVPGVGEAAGAIDVAQSLKSKKYLGAGLNTAALALGTAPIIGDAAGKALRAIGKKIYKPKVYTRKDGSIIDEKDADFSDIQEAYKLEKSQRQIQTPQLKEAAQLLKDEKINKETFDEIADTFYPSKLITELPEVPIPRRIEAVVAGKKAQGNVITPERSKELAGQKVSTRLDIPAYNNYNTWVVTVASPDNTFKSTYGESANLTKVVFGSPTGQAKALKIAIGGAKTPFAVMEGTWKNKSTEELALIAQKHLANPAKSDWIQVGMNPYKHSYFYDKASMLPVISADEVIQIGSLVLAKGTKYGKKTDYKFKKGGTMAKDAQAETITIGLKDEGGMVDEASGNEVPNGALKEEVRDDQPAMLSPGEFVIPAYAVRYIGVERLVGILREAKQGMEQLDDIGLTGEPNSDDAGLETAVLPSEMQEEGGMPTLAVGGMPTIKPGAVTTKALTNQPTQQPFGVAPPAAIQPAAAPAFAAPSPLTQQMYRPTAPIRPPAQQNVTYPEFQYSPTPGGGGYGVEEYVGPQGQAIFVTTVGGKPVSKIPEGYVTRAEYTKKQEEGITTPTSPTELQRKPEDMDPGDVTEGYDSESGNDGGKGAAAMYASAVEYAYGSRSTAGTVGAAATGFLGGGILGGILGLLGIGDKAGRAAAKAYVESEAGKYHGTKGGQLEGGKNIKDLTPAQRQDLAEKTAATKTFVASDKGRTGSITQFANEQANDQDNAFAAGKAIDAAISIYGEDSDEAAAVATNNAGQYGITVGGGGTGTGSDAAAPYGGDAAAEFGVGDSGGGSSGSSGSDGSGNYGSDGSMEGVGMAEGGFIKKKTRKRKPRGKGLASSM